jgi:hypothetical protein
MRLSFKVILQWSYNQWRKQKIFHKATCNTETHRNKRSIEFAINTQMHLLIRLFSLPKRLNYKTHLSNQKLMKLIVDHK